MGVNMASSRIHPSLLFEVLEINSRDKMTSDAKNQLLTTKTDYTVREKQPIVPIHSGFLEVVTLPSVLTNKRTLAGRQPTIV